MNKKREIEVLLSPTLYAGRLLTQECVTVVVDVLRATTSICAAFRAGVQEVLPLNTVDHLSSYAAQGYRIAAERNAQKLPSATLGNSPTEYLAQDLQGCRVAFSSTNGTAGILLARDSEQVVVGCFANISALSAWLQRQPLHVVILCSGWNGDPSLEDTLFAGALAERLLQQETYAPANDAVLMATALFHAARPDMWQYCRTASHVQRLLRMKYEEDIRFAFREDTCPVVPVYDKVRGILHL